MRKKLGDSIPLSETTRVIAEKWRNAEGSTRQEYERRAAKGNIVLLTNKAKFAIIDDLNNHVT